MPDIRWRGQEHKTLYDWINSGPGSTASTPQLEYWSGLKQALVDISNKLNTSLNDIGATWEGLAGASASNSLTPLQQWAEEAQHSVDVMSASAQEQADNVATARAAMPEPQKVETGAVAPWQIADAKEAAKDGDKGPAKAIAQQAADHEAQETAAADSHEMAVKVMSNYQSASEHNAATLGHFGSPPDLVVAVQMPNGQDSTSLDYFGMGSGSSHGGHQSQQGVPTQGTPTQGVQPLAASAGAQGTEALSTGGGGGGISAAALGGVGAGLGVAGGVAALRQLNKRAPGGSLGVGPANAQARNDRERPRPTNTRPAPEPQAARPMPGMVPPMAGGMGGNGGGDQSRGGNRYLNNTIPNNVQPIDGGPGSPAPIAQGGTAGVGPGGTGAAGNTGAPPIQGGGGPAAGHGPAAPMYGPPQGGGFGGAPGAMPPAAGGGGFGGDAQDEQHESASYLVEADGVFDDGRMVAPSVLGGEEEQR